jgi:hypothetical protein
LKKLAELTDIKLDDGWIPNVNASDWFAQGDLLSNCCVEPNRGSGLGQLPFVSHGTDGAD